MKRELQMEIIKAAVDSPDSIRASGAKILEDAATATHEAAGPFEQRMAEKVGAHA